MDASRQPSLLMGSDDAPHTLVPECEQGRLALLERAAADAWQRCRNRSALGDSAGGALYRETARLRARLAARRREQLRGWRLAVS